MDINRDLVVHQCVDIQAAVQRVQIDAKRTKKEPDQLLERAQAAENVANDEDLLVQIGHLHNLVGAMFDYHSHMYQVGVIPYEGQD